MTVTLRPWHLALLIAALAASAGIVVGVLLTRDSSTTVVTIETIDDASRQAARAYVMSAVPAIEAYHADTGSYHGMTVERLLAIDDQIESVQLRSVKAASYCIESSVNGATASYSGPGDVALDGPCP